MLGGIEEMIPSRGLRIPELVVAGLPDDDDAEVSGVDQGDLHSGRFPPKNRGQWSKNVREVDHSEKMLWVALKRREVLALPNGSPSGGGHSLDNHCLLTDPKHDPILFALWT